METPPSSDLPHSGWGIASLIISLLSWPLVLILAALLEKTQPQPMPRATPGNIPPGLFSWLIEDVLFKGFKEGLAELAKAALMFPGLTLLLALGLGIAGWIQPDQDSLFAVLGVLAAASGLVWVIILALI